MTETSFSSCAMRGVKVAGGWTARPQRTRSNAHQQHSKRCLSAILEYLEAFALRLCLERIVELCIKCETRMANIYIPPEWRKSAPTSSGTPCPSYYIYILDSFTEHQYCL